MTEPLIDGTYQIRQGEDFAIPLSAGGTGRVDGGSPLTVVRGQNDSGSTIVAGTVVKVRTSYPVGPGLEITPTTAVGDVTLGVAIEDIANGATGGVAIIGAPVLVNTTGTINDGDLLVPSSTAGLATALSGVNDVAFGVALNEASGTSSVYAVLLGLFKSFNYVQFPSAVNIVIGDGVTVVTTGDKGFLRWPFAGTLKRVSLMADQSGSIVVDIYKDSWANFPPVAGDTITAAAKPTLPSAQKMEDTTLTGWTKTFVQGDVYRLNVDSAATLKQVTLELKYERTGL